MKSLVHSVQDFLAVGGSFLYYQYSHAVKNKTDTYNVQSEIELVSFIWELKQERAKGEDIRYSSRNLTQCIHVNIKQHEGQNRSLWDIKNQGPQY